MRDRLKVPTITPKLNNTTRPVQHRPNLEGCTLFFPSCGPKIGAHHNMLGEFTFKDFIFLVLCDMCGHLCYECDTLILNEIVVCEDCRDFRDAGSRFVVGSPDTSEFQPTSRSLALAFLVKDQCQAPGTSEYQPTSRSRVHKTTERPTGSPAGSSPTPPNEKTGIESKGPIRAIGAGSLQNSTVRNRDALSRESRKDKQEKWAVELRGGQAVPPLAKRQEHKQSGSTRARMEGRPQSSDVQDTVSRLRRADSQQNGGKGCLSSTVLLVLGALAVVLLLMYIPG